MENPGRKVDRIVFQTCDTVFFGALSAVVDPLRSSNE